MNIRTEKIYPYLLAVMCGAVVWYFDITISAGDRTDFLAASISLGAIWAGFITTAKAILMALPPDGVIRELKQSGYINCLALYLQEALYGALVFAMFNISGYFIAGALPSLFLVLWGILAVFCLTTFERLARLLMKMLARPDKLR